MIFLELLRMNHAKITTDSDSFSVANIGSFELLVLFFRQVGHGSFKFGDDRSGGKGTGGEDTQFGLAGTMRVAGRVGDLNRAGWEVELKVTRSVAGVYTLGKANARVGGDNNIRGERVDLFLF